MNKLVSHIQAILVEIIKEIYKIEISKNEISLETPPKKELGDYAFPCFGLSKTLKKGPAQIAQEIIDFVNKNKEKYSYFSSLEIAGPYLNLRLDKAFLSSYFIENHKDILNLLDKSNEDKTIVIDYIGANVGKPLHIGHMCTPTQGQVLINLFEKTGYKVISDSHFGDWGGIFGKLIFYYKLSETERIKINQNEIDLTIEDQKIYSNFFNIWKDNPPTDENVLNANIEIYNIQERSSKNGFQLPDDFLMKMFYSYISATYYCENFPEMENQARVEFKKLSEGDKLNGVLWSKITSNSISAVNILLEKLRIYPKYNIGESFYEGLNLPRPNDEDYPNLTYDMNQIVDELVKLNIATKNDDGSVGVVFPDETKIPSCILQKRDGTHGYLASDLACVKYRMQNWNPEKIIYFVDVRQQLHLKQVFTISKMAGWVDDKTETFHAYNGFISLKDGAMSTRKGRIIKLEALLDEAEDRAKKIILEKRDDIKGDELDLLAKQVGIGAIKYGYLSKNRTLDTIFDWDEFMTFEGNSGPYIQYAYVRARNILQNSNYSVIARDEAIQKTGNNIVNGLLRKNSQGQDDTLVVSFDHDEEIDLAKELFNYKTILAETATSYYPHLICNYAYNLTKKFNSFYNKVHILSEENEDKKQLKLLLVDQFSQVLKDAFEILGIEMPDKM